MDNCGNFNFEFYARKTGSLQIFFSKQAVLRSSVKNVRCLHNCEIVTYWSRHSANLLIDNSVVFNTDEKWVVTHHWVDMYYFQGLPRIGGPSGQLCELCRLPEVSQYCYCRVCSPHCLQQHEAEALLLPLLVLPPPGLQIPLAEPAGSQIRCYHFIETSTG